MTLHEKREKLPRQNGRPKTTQQIADGLNKNGWYQKKDGSTIVGFIRIIMHAKFGLLLTFLDDENTSSTNTSKLVLPDSSSNIFFGNSWLSPTLFEKKNQTKINPFGFSKLRFLKNITPHELPIYKINYISAHRQFNKYFLGVHVRSGFSLQSFCHEAQKGTPLQFLTQKLHNY